MYCLICDKTGVAYKLTMNTKMNLIWPLNRFKNNDKTQYMYIQIFNKSGLISSICRGQESAGITTSSGKEGCKYVQKKGMGLVSSIFHDDDLVKLKGNLGIGNPCVYIMSRNKKKKNKKKKHHFSAEPRSDKCL